MIRLALVIRNGDLNPADKSLREDGVSGQSELITVGHKSLLVISPKNQRRRDPGTLFSWEEKRNVSGDMRSNTAAVLRTIISAGGITIGITRKPAIPSHHLAEGSIRDLTAEFAGHDSETKETIVELCRVEGGNKSPV